MTSPRILMIGRTGQVARAVLASAAAQGLTITALGREQIDLINPPLAAATIARTLAGHDLVLNTAAYTAVDKAETEPAVAYRVNGESVGEIAYTCAKAGVPLLHISTDYVFDGQKSEPYVENDKPAPLSIYGQSKLAGEEAIRQCGVRHAIVRTSWVYDAQGKNFLSTILRLGAERDLLRIVDDQWGAPTTADSIATALLIITQKITSETVPEMLGTFHFTASGKTTWRRFAEKIFACAPNIKIKAKIEPISTSQYPTPAQRPHNSRLCCDKIQSTFNIVGEQWEEGLVRMLAQLRDGSITHERHSSRGG